MSKASKMKSSGTGQSGKGTAGQTVGMMKSFV